MTLDINTLILLIVYATFVSGLGLVFMAKEFPNRRGLRIWGYASFTMSLGWMVNGALRGVLPDILSIYVGNLVITCSIMAWAYVIFEFLEKAPPKKTYASLLLLSFVSLYYYTNIDANLYKRIIIISFVNGYIIAGIIRGLFQNRKTNPLIYYYNISFFCVCCLAVFFRMFYYLSFFDESGSTANVDKIVNGATYAIFFLSILMSPFGFLLLNDDSYIRSIERAKETIQKLSIGIEQSPLSILITDLKGKIEYINHTFTEITGYTFEEVKGKNPNILKSGNTTTEEYKKIWETLLDGNVWKGNFYNKKKNGDHYWESAILSPVKNESGKIINIIGIKQDITKQKETEENLIFAKEEAESANRLKTQFLANMSHDIRTPMNAVLGFSELLKEKVGSDKEMSDYLEAIQRSGRTLVALINDILDLAKIEAGLLEIQKSNVDLVAILEEIKHLFSLSVKEKGIFLEIKVDPGFPETLIMDELRIRQVLLNLIGNAIKFTETGGITVKLESILQGEDFVSLQIKIIDTGIGISREDQERVFHAFLQKTGQNQARYGGSGLGLSISKRLVELMDGQILIESEIGKGSTFTVALEKTNLGSRTARSGFVGESKKPEKKEIVGEFSQFQILLVEDTPENRMVVTGLLKNSKVKIIEAENGRVALEKLKTNPIDLIFMDIQMPEMNGVEAAEIIRADEAMKKIPLIFLTADAMPEDIQKYSHLSDGYLTKPITKEILLSTMRRFLRDC